MYYFCVQPVVFTSPLIFCESLTALSIPLGPSLGISMIKEKRENTLNSEYIFTEF